MHFGCPSEQTRSHWQRIRKLLPLLDESQKLDLRRHNLVVRVLRQATVKNRLEPVCCPGDTILD